MHSVRGTTIEGNTCPGNHRASTEAIRDITAIRDFASATLTRDTNLRDTARASGTLPLRQGH